MAEVIVMHPVRFLLTCGLWVALLSGGQGFGQPTAPASAIEGPPLDYWVVGTHRCSQRDVAACTAENFQYWHMGADGRIRRFSVDAFRKWLQPAVPVCIVVHGSYTSTATLIDESGEMYRWIRSAAPERPLQVVFFSWPSGPPTLVLFQLDIGILGRRASLNGFYLADFVCKLPPDSPVSFFGHSHGARTVAATLHLLAGGEVLKRRLRRCPDQKQPMRAVLSAAAIDRHWLNPGGRFGRALFCVDRLVYLRNREDPALAAYPARRPFSNRALGEAGLDGVAWQMLGQQAQKVSEIDVTALIGPGHYWNYYFERPQIARAIVPVLYFADQRAVILHSSSVSKHWTTVWGRRPSIH